MPDQEGKEVILVLPMLPDMELAATKTAEALGQYISMDDDKLADISLALIEACLNAFEHSKSEDSNVTVIFTVYPDQLKIELKDKGVGFDPSKIAAPDITSKVMGKQRKRGWGMHLMKSLMDDVSIRSDESGTVVTMIKKK